MNRIVDITYLWSDNAHDFARDAVGFLKTGWQPFGPAQLSTTGKGCVHYTYLQTFVKYAEDASK